MFVFPNLLCHEWGRALFMPPEFKHAVPEVIICWMRHVPNDGTPDCMCKTLWFLYFSWCCRLWLWERGEVTSQVSFFLWEKPIILYSVILFPLENIFHMIFCMHPCLWLILLEFFLGYLSCDIFFTISLVAKRVSAQSSAASLYNIKSNCIN